MSNVTGRDRVVTALAHKTPDKVPLDFGGTAVTGMHVSCVEELRRHYGLRGGPVKVKEPYQMLGWIEDDLAEAMGIDTVSVMPRKTLFGFTNERWKRFNTPWGQEVLVSTHFVTKETPEGGLFIFPEGDASVPPSGKMPKSGFHFDAIIRQEPFDENTLDPADNLEEFGPISAEDLAHLASEIKGCADKGRAVVASMGGLALGDIAMVPAPFMKHPKGIRDITEWYMSTSIRQDYIHAVFEKQCEYSLANLAALHAEVGEAIDVLFICGTDFGTQTSQFCSGKTFSELYLPYYRKLNQWIHTHTTWKTFKHSCGAVEPLMRLFIECGFDIINPVQCSAKGMDPSVLKERYGDRLLFWGGGVDTQQTLPFGTKEQVRVQVLKRCEVFSTNGGFVFNAIHNIQPNTPLENIIAMLDAVKEFNGVLV